MTYCNWFTTVTIHLCGEKQRSFSLSTMKSIYSRKASILAYFWSWSDMCGSSLAPRWRNLAFACQINSTLIDTDAHVIQAVALSAFTVFLLVFILFFLVDRGIQQQHSGEASSHHRISSSWLSLPHRCSCPHHRLQSVSQSCLAPL